MSSAITPADIIDFWRTAGRERWFKRSDEFDARLRARFPGVWEGAAAGDYLTWAESDDGLLALILLLDQFPRNLFRDDARAFATDAAARALVAHAIIRGADQRIEPALRSFVYMPMMHSESLADQERSEELFEGLGHPDNIKFAKLHADIIRRFGRFPHRNRVLGRTTTADEQAFLDSGGFAG